MVLDGRGRRPDTGQVFLVIQAISILDNGLDRFQIYGRISNGMIGKFRQFIGLDQCRGFFHAHGRQQHLARRAGQ